MTEKRKILNIEVDGRAVTLTISRATARMGVNRILLANQGVEQNNKELEKGIGTQAERILRVITYPDCISAVTECQGMPWPVTLERFCDLDEIDVDQWSTFVYEVNPNWSRVATVTEVEASQIKKGRKTSSRNSAAISTSPPTTS
jgi:hypothetical protein